VLAALSECLQHFIYISSTGVYEQTDGQWVDEATPCHPVRAGGLACLHAEQRLAKSPFGDRRIILRLAGLYGPDRLPKLAAVRSGTPIEVAEDGYLNLIHVDDAAEIAASVEDFAVSPDMLNIADGHPVLRRDFYRELARQTNAPPPQFVAPNPASSNAERGSTDKRVSNRKMISLYGRPLRYPSYREGLAAIVAPNTG
jgi:nucleoside-diphosphate-sugar epimerase